MFLIVPKPSKPCHTPSNNNQPITNTAPLAPDITSRGPTRAVAACDRCRIRKVKCNGKEPCQRCLQSGNICVFSKPRDEVGLVSGAYVSMLKSQQRRLVVALRNMDSIIEGQPRPSTDHQHNSHDEFDLTAILEKYAPCSKYEALKESTLQKAPNDRNRGPQKKRRFQHNPPLEENAPNWPGISSSGIAPAPQSPTTPWPAGDPSYDLGGQWSQLHSSSDPSLVESMHDSENTPETRDQWPPGPGLNMSPTELQRNGANNGFGDNFTPNAAGLSTPPPGSELTPYNMNLEELSQLIDWDASWQSCSDHFPMPDSSRAIGSGQSSMDWEH